MILSFWAHHREILEEWLKTSLNILDSSLETCFSSRYLSQKSEKTGRWFMKCLMNVCNSNGCVYSHDSVPFSECFLDEGHLCWQYLNTALSILQGTWCQGKVSSVQSLSSVRLFATPWITACQASLSVTNSRSSLKHIHQVSDAIQPSHPPSSPSPPAPNPSQHQSFPMSQLFAWGGQNTGALALASFLAKNTQGWSPLEWTGWISLQSKGLSRVFSNSTVQKHQFFGAQPSSQSNSHIHTWLREKP